MGESRTILRVDSDNLNKDEVGRTIFTVDSRCIADNLNKDEVEFHLYLCWKEPCSHTILDSKHWIKMSTIKDLLEDQAWIYKMCSPLKTNLKGGIHSDDMDKLVHKIKDVILWAQEEGYIDRAIMVRTDWTVTVLNSTVAKEVNSICFGKDEMEFQQTHCPICLEAFQEGLFLAQLQHCRHTFHFLCIDKWWFGKGVTHHRFHCPCCRQSLGSKSK